MKNTILFFVLAILFTLSACDQKEKHEHIEITTDFGVMKVKLYNTTPQHRNNMVKLAGENFYEDLLFHRIVPQFKIQGGDPESKGAPPTKQLGSGGPGYKIPAEISAPHIKGAIAAARTQNPQKESSGSQFYIVQGKKVTDNELDAVEKRKNIKYSPEQRKLYKELGGAPHLDMDYTVYGEVVEGMDVIDKIAAVPVNGQRPVNDVKMNVKLLEKE